MKIIQPSVTLEWVTPNPLAVIERAGRTCYKSEGKIEPGSAARFVKKINDLGHHSVLEHAVASFRIVCDRGISHEIVRHRIASYSQESTRYVNYKEGLEVVCPVELRPCAVCWGLYSEANGDPQEVPWKDVNSCSPQCANFGHWVWAVNASELAYHHLIESGQKPQIARSVLPTCLKTELVMTTNFREWLHFLKLRDSKAAHPQMREIAKMVRAELHKICPEIFSEVADG
jgi:thymidylate synthase (FAD)